MPQGPKVPVRGPYRSEDFACEDQEIVQEWRVPHSLRAQWLAWCLGYSSSAFAGTPPDPLLPGLLERVLPDQDPEFPWFYATRARLNSPDRSGAPVSRDLPAKDKNGDPIMDDGTPPAQIIIPALTYADKQGDDFYDGWLSYYVTYKPLPYDLRTDTQIVGYGSELGRFVDRQFDWTIRNIPIPANRLKFAEGPSSGQAIPANAAHLLPGCQLVYAWKQVPDLPVDAIRDGVGTVNSADFDTQWPPFASIGAWPAETLLCQPPKIRRYRSLTGRITWEIVYRFDYNPNTWNKLPANNGQFYLATRDGTLTGP